MNQPSWTGDPFYFTTTSGNVTLPGDSLSVTYNISSDGEPVKPNISTVPYLYDEWGVAVPGAGARIWKGDDATYLNFTLSQAHVADAPRIGALIEVCHSSVSTVGAVFVVREVTQDMRTWSYTVSCIDVDTFTKRTKTKPLVKPPQFASIEQADAWLEAHRRG
jgi:hypothetical protein